MKKTYEKPVAHKGKVLQAIAAFNGNGSKCIAISTGVICLPGNGNGNGAIVLP